MMTNGPNGLGNEIAISPRHLDGILERPTILVRDYIIAAAH
jgi:hypothetical protein